MDRRRFNALIGLATAFVFCAAFTTLAHRSNAATRPFRALLVGNCNTPTTPFCDAEMPPTPGWNGHVFHLSQNYPHSVPAGPQPWLQFEPTKQPFDYLKAALAYFYEGNVQPDTESSFDPALNRVRGWYNAPWQDTGTNGREFVHGLTRERVSRKFELDPHQSTVWNNYAVGFYNAAGAVTIGNVWANHGAPNPAAASMPQGTVAAKLLFTTATTDEVPYLQGAPEWDAYVYANVHDPGPASGSPRAIVKVRLLQIDIAVKDSRVANNTGWVFGTFVYGGGPGGAVGSGWTNVVPVGVMWGNDPGFSGSGTLSQTKLNDSVHMPHVGYQGRLNGPVDNAVSSCLSCHSTAEVPVGAMIPSTTDPAPWFRNIPSGTAFDAGRVATDYSLQLSLGISNFKGLQAVRHAANPHARASLIKQLQTLERRPPRDGGLVH